MFSACGVSPGAVSGGASWAGQTGTVKVAEHCVEHLDRAGYAEAFQAARGPAWDGGDMSVAAVIDADTRVWLFGDTFTGVIGSDGGIKDPYDLLHNSIVVQRKKCFEFYMGAVAGTISELIPDPEVRHRYWPCGAFPVVENGKVTEIRVLATHGHKPRGYEGSFSVRLVGAVLVRLSWPDLRVRGVTELGAPAQLIMQSMVDGRDGWHYIYAHRRAPGPLHYVARAHDSDLARGRAWWWDGRGWARSATAAVPMKFFDGTERDDGPYATPFVIADGRGFMASATRVQLLADDVTAWWATNPWGPWHTASTRDGRVATLPHGKGMYRYGGQVSVLPGLGATVIWNDSPGFAGVVANASAYGPRFAAPTGIVTPWRSGTAG